MKADLFNDFFVDNGSTLPASHIRPDQTLEFIDIDDHLKAIGNLNANEAHGCDDISIRMLKICDDSIVCLCAIFLPNAWNFKHSHIMEAC